MTTPNNTDPARCRAAHPEDPAACTGAGDAVVVADRAGTRVPGCVLHAARMLASLNGGTVHPGTVHGAATDVHRLARSLPPFAWRQNGGAR
ncbi:hypothetical protein ACFW9F_01725 [Streptomyces sp. NPDC059506]|uniref:hypothetical protein n=1 Tax=Streptomyces sp. NPDC059506 TaxID=3347751 RepID=UPI0036BBE5FF